MFAGCPGASTHRESPSHSTRLCLKSSWDRHLACHCVTETSRKPFTRKNTRRCRVFPSDANFCQVVRGGVEPPTHGFSVHGYGNYKSELTSCFPTTFDDNKNPEISGAAESAAVFQINNHFRGFGPDNCRLASTAQTRPRCHFHSRPGYRRLNAPTCIENMDQVIEETNSNSDLYALAQANERESENQKNSKNRELFPKSTAWLCFAPDGIGGLADLS